MNLRELAEQDLGMILEDADTGFGWSIVLTDPDGVSASLIGQSQDISLAVDPDTGMLVSGRTATVALRISSLRAAGFATNPKNVPEQNRKPWVVGFRDINGVPCLFKVMKSNPDVMLGIITCVLETYRQAVFYNGAWTFDGSQDYDGVIKLL